ncbi:hypothetical protein N7466_005917 [Penicillium verhagenii]|uniref:uncharacterized protein n=1 Tax=Penicillium verhagenii TaxID=1562060 RepID=UPI0025455FB4|nr:uncharacterized protein N7466_005917 [Penicillium verhagenii]KAJ5930424.1 hypothetical protein N7466_005917 [Penicillium verhagenii]
MATGIAPNVWEGILKIRGEYIKSLTAWELGLTSNPKLTHSANLSHNIIMLVEHIERTFLRIDILDCPDKPFCYQPRVYCIISVLLDTIEMLQTQKLAETAPGVLANILRMLIIQVGRLTLAHAGDDSATDMDLSADIMDTCVSLGILGGCDEQQKAMLAVLWGRMHFVGMYCNCVQCGQRLLMPTCIE